MTRLTYSLTQRFVRWGLKAYYRKIYFTGAENIPKDKPVILAANHSNGLIDPVLIGAIAAPEMHYLTRGDVFTPATERFFRQINMYPVYRIRDGYHLLARNEATFKRCFDALMANGNIIIFAEGDCEAEKQLRTLRKGTARIAFQAMDELGLDVQVLPVGINYVEHTGYRKDVMLDFGAPVPVSQYRELYATHKARAIKAFNRDLSERMRSHMVHLEDLELKELHDATMQVVRARHKGLRYWPLVDRKDGDRLALERQATHYINRIANAPETEELNDFKERVLSLAQRAKKHDLDLAELGHKPGTLWSFLMPVLLLPYLVLWLLNGPPLWLAEWITGRKVKQAIFVSTFRCFVGVLLHALYTLLLTVVGVAIWGWWGLVLLVLLPLSWRWTSVYGSVTRVQLARGRWEKLARQQPEVALGLLKAQRELWLEMGLGV